MNVIRVFRVPTAAACLAVALCGQTSIDLRTQSRNIDFSGAISTKPVKAGTALPAVCSVGELYYRTNAPAGQNLFGCTATNLWTLLGGGASASHADQHKHGGSDEVATSTPSANAIPKASGSGKLASGWLDVQGNGAKFQMFGGGTPAAEECAKFDGNGNLVGAGGPCGTAGTVYAAGFSSAATWVVSGATHGLGTCDLVASLYEANGTQWTAVHPDTLRCETAAGANQYDVTVTWSTPQAGRLVLVKSGGTGAGGGSATWGSITGTLSAQVDLQSALDAKESAANKNAASGYAGLTAGGKLQMGQGQEVWALADLSDVSGKRGTSGQVQMAAGTFAGDDCAKFDASGNVVSAGTPCAAGGLGDPGGNGLVVRTAVNTTTARSLVGTSNKITVTNGDAVSGNPTLTIGSDVVDKTGATSYSAGAKQTFLHSGSLAGMNVGPAAGDPSTPADGDVWYNATTNKFRKRENGVTSDLDTSGSGLPASTGANKAIFRNNADNDAEWRTCGAGLDCAAGAFRVDPGTVPQRITATATLDFPSTAQSACNELTLSLPGASPGEEVMLGPPAAVEGGFLWGGYVSSAGVVSVRLCKITSGTVDPAAASWRATIVRSF